MNLPIILLAASILALTIISIFRRRWIRDLEKQLRYLYVQMEHVEAKLRGSDSAIRELSERYYELFKMLKTSVSVDVGGPHDCGWLIFIAKVNGEDMVRIQHLRPDMSMKDYQDMLIRLSDSCRHIAYIEGPRYCEEFLRNTIKNGRITRGW